MTIETLREEHRNIGRLLDALDHQIDVFAASGEPDYDVITGIADYFLEYPNTCHHPKEDIIFDRLTQADLNDALALGDLRDEHNRVGQPARRFRAAVRDLFYDTDIARAAIVDAARVFIAAERRHMQWEEEYFLPLSERVLTVADWTEIERTLIQARDPLFGQTVEKRFQNQRERLLNWEREYQLAHSKPAV